MADSDTNLQRQQLIVERLTASLEPSEIEVTDESYLHEGHPEAEKHGGGHFKLLIVSHMFQEKTELERHRMIYMALGDTVGQEIHALSIKALTPEEQSKPIIDDVEK